MTLIELPRRRPPRIFVETTPGLERRVSRALSALGDLPDSLADLPGLSLLAEALIEFADAIDGDADLEPEDDCDGEEERLSLFAFAGLTRPP